MARRKGKQTMKALLGFAIMAMTLGFPIVASAEWVPNGSSVSTVTSGKQWPKVISDGSTGAIVVWEDFRDTTNLNLYAQHLVPSGVDPTWPSGGVLISNAPDRQGTGNGDYALVSDNAGGAMLAWLDYRSGTQWDVYAAHLKATGVMDPLWPTNGRAVCTAAGTRLSCQIVTNASAGDAIITWSDDRGSGADIYAMRILGNGTLDAAWPANGLLVCSAASAQINPMLITDGTGGAIIAWSDNRNGTDYDVYGQHVKSNATLDSAWPVAGLLLSGGATSQTLDRIVTDGSTGALLVFTDARTGSSHTAAQHVSLAGVIDSQFGANGVQVVVAANSQYSPDAAPDGAGGLFITWNDSRAAPNTFDVYVGHLKSNGVMDANWGGQSSRALCTLPGNQLTPSIIGDGAGGCFVAWQDHRASGTAYDCYAQHVLANGTVDPAWTFNGQGLCTGTVALIPYLASDTLGGGFIVWNDFRNGVRNADIFANRFSASGLHRITASKLGSGTVQWLAPAATTLTTLDLTAYDTARLISTPTAGSFIDAVSVNGIAIGVPPNYTFTNVTSDQQYSVNFSNTSSSLLTTSSAGTYASFAVPLTFANDSLSALLPALWPADDTRWRMAHWDPLTKAYAFDGGALQRLVPGQGYWWVTAAGSPVNYSGTPVTSATFSVGLLGNTTSGWNQIANPYRFPIADTALTISDGVVTVPLIASGNSLADSALYEWTGGSTYVTAHTMQPFKAYWIHKKVNGTVTLRFPNASSTRTVGPVPNRPADANWALAMTAAQGDERSSRIRLGRWSGASALRPFTEESPPPAPAGGLTLSLHGVTAQELAHFAGANEAPAWEFDIANAQAPGEVVLATEGFDVPPGTRFVLADESSGDLQTFTAGEAVSLAASASPRRYRLTIAGAGAAEHADLTARVRAYPNPFHSTLGLEWSGAVASRLHVELYDIAGRLVRTLEQQASSAGQHVLSWDGRDSGGALLRPGVYLARYRSGAMTGTARMVKTD
jgi:hypothetical protein